MVLKEPPLIAGSSSSFTSFSQRDTEQFGEKLALSLREGDTLLLHGDLGAGKTALTRGIVNGLHGKTTDVKSPSYTLLNIYDGTPAVYHFDFYRLEDSSDIVELGFDDYFGNGISIVEWPKNFCDRLPGRRVDIVLESDGENKREIRVNEHNNA